jgi:antitoxin component of RelBE/YafQ-DinJ toxin-antitoxin module
MLNFRIEPELQADLERIREESGVTVSEQIRRALEAWVAQYQRQGTVPRKRTTKAGQAGTGSKKAKPA